MRSPVVGSFTNKEMEWVWRKAILLYFNGMSRNFPGKAEERNEKINICGLRVEN
jgi:hypothetical protein